MMDLNDRMTSLTDIDGSVFAYEFDGEGNRLSQSLNDCLSKRFVYDGADVLLELNPTNGVAYAWVNGPGIDQPIERLLFIDGSPRARRVFHADALGSIAALTDPNGLVTQTYAYAAFGSLRSSTGPDLNRVTYTGRECLGDSQGWMYYRFRTYSSSIGRFVSPDPMKFIYYLNIWIYVANNALIFYDPFGLAPDNTKAFMDDWKANGPDPELIDVVKNSCFTANREASDLVVGFASPLGSGLAGVIEEVGIKAFVSFVYPFINDWILSFVHNKLLEIERESERQPCLCPNE